uniref:CARMIL C-terminal domain-containing protein n=1 Tax=Lutzomyia longipalpis TaxID=7200 RepID=A0A1B0CTE4_LUTLO
PFREEVAWDIDTIYLSHDTRILNLRDFDHLEPKDLMAIISALEYNTFFRGLKVSHTRLSNESLDRILHVLRRSMWLEELHLEALGLRSDFLHKLAVSVITNNNPALRTIDLSHNVIEDKGAIHLAGPIAKVSKGLCKLSLSHCGLTAKGVNQIAHSLSLNQSISNSLTYLDLSGNNLKDDINNLYNFLAQPNVLEHLNISATDTTLENLFGALLRGCGTHLAHLNVSHNSFNTKKGKEIPPSFKQFFTSSLSLKHINISYCKLPMEALKHLLLGLACNESTAGLYLDLSCNQLGSQGAHVLESCIHGVRVLQSLDISDNKINEYSETMETMLRTGVDQCPKSLGNQNVINELRKNCLERLNVSEEFLTNCIVNSAGSEIMNKISEVEQALAGVIADRATDEVVEALTRYRRGLGIADSPHLTYDDLNTPDVLRSRSNQNFKDSIGLMSLETHHGLDLPKLGLDSPTATPHLTSKRRSIAKKVRPQSVVGLGIENLSLGHIPDLLESPVSHRGGVRDKTDENCDSITELPSASLQLQHLVKGRPKRAKTRAPTRPLLQEHTTHGDGLEQFFRPGSVTPTTNTPLVSPTSEECSSLSFVDSPTMSRDENGKFCMTSGETTPILEERRAGVAWTPRSRSTDNLEKCSPVIGRKSPLVKMNTDASPTAAGQMQQQILNHETEERLIPPVNHDGNKLRSPSNESIKSHVADLKTTPGNGIVKTPLISPKPRPWSVAGNEAKSDYGSGSDSTKTTPDGIDNDVDVVPIVGQAPGGSIVGISPGIGLGGGSIVGITPGAALERKSVRDMAAGLNRLGVVDPSKKPLPVPRKSNNFSNNNNSSSVNMNATNDVNVEESPSSPSVDAAKSESVRKIAGKNISTLFEETLVEGLQKSYLRQTVYKETQYTKDDSVDV